MSKTDQTDQKNPLKELIEESLEELLKIDNEKQQPSSGSRIIFPVKRDGSVRVSEQEAKQLFLKQLENQTHFVYSVETPTKYTYSGFAKKQPRIYSDPNKGRSGSMDVCLHEAVNNRFERRHLIEFKARNTDEADIAKDFLKLKYENDDKQKLINYFVHIIEKSDDSAIDSLNTKYQNAFAIQNSNFEKLHPVKNKIIVYLCFLDRSDNPQILFLD
jgi:hypothetical protein